MASSVHTLPIGHFLRFESLGLVSDLGVAWLPTNDIFALQGHGPLLNNPPQPEDADIRDEPGASAADEGAPSADASTSRVLLVLASPWVLSCQEPGTARTLTPCVSSDRGLQVSMVVMRRVVLFRRLCRQLSRLLLQLLLKGADLGGWCALSTSVQGKYLLNLGGSVFALFCGLMACIL